MEIILIEVTSPKAYKLLEDLEDLQILKVLSKSTVPTEKLSDKYAGKLPGDIADKLQTYVEEGRIAWNNQSI